MSQLFKISTGVITFYSHPKIIALCEKQEKFPVIRIVSTFPWTHFQKS